MTQTKHPFENLSLWQRIGAVLFAIASITASIIIGAVLLYVLFAVIAFGLIVAAGFYLWRRITGKASKRPVYHDGMRIREDEDGVVIDMDAQTPNSEKKDPS